MTTGIIKSMNREKKSIYASIMAGGRGERFWPLSRSSNPKQFLKIGEEKSLIELTVERIMPLIDEGGLTVITRREYGFKIKELIPNAIVLEEPVGKNTAPACFYSAWWVNERDHDGVLIVLPADHWIGDDEKFRDTLLRGVEFAMKGYLVTFGIKPSRPETGYGYIERGDRIEGVDSKAFIVKQFKEKPDKTTAEKFLELGRFYWNSGIFVWKASTLLDAFRKYSPHFFDILERHDLGTKEGVEGFYREIPENSIDYEIMEKAQNKVVVEADFPWEDLGSFASLKTILKRDDRGNFALGEYISIDSKDNVVVSEGGLVALIGVEGITVVHTQDVTLIVPVEEAQRVKEIVKKIEKVNDLRKYTQ